MQVEVLKIMCVILVFLGVRRDYREVRFASLFLSSPAIARVDSWAMYARDLRAEFILL